MHNAVENGATKAKHTRKFKSCLLTRKNPLKHKLTLDEKMFNRPLRII